MTKEEVLKACIVDGTHVKLPAIQLDRGLYMEVAKSLAGIGGKWKGGKVSAFIFPNDPTNLLARICGGEKISHKKDYQFFATPDRLADRLVSLADLERHHIVLEPSAGDGAIVKAIHRNSGIIRVHTYEAMEINRSILRDMFHVDVLGEDFLKAVKSKNAPYFRIIANPPFSKNQDIDHVLKMYEMLSENGILVSIMSNHWRTSKNRKELEFSAWLSSVKHEIHAVPSGTFKESGTQVGACIVKIWK